MGDHLIVLHSAVRACAGYSRHDAPSILMDGSSIARDTEHGRAITAQLTRRHGTLEEAIEAGIFALGAAGLSKGIRRQAREACEDYFYTRLSLTPSDELGGPEAIPDRLELMPDAMYRALEDIVELVVDGDYEELRAASRDRLGSRTCAVASRTTAPSRWCCRRARSTGSRRSPSPTTRTCRAGPTSSTCGPRPARRACTSRASSRSRASASRRR